MPDTPMPGSLAAETARRRTFAIISHPDAGKTTLTEKLLLYSARDSHRRFRQSPQDRDKHATSRLDGYRETARHFRDLLGHAV